MLRRDLGLCPGQDGLVGKRGDVGYRDLRRLLFRFNGRGRSLYGAAAPGARESAMFDFLAAEPACNRQDMTSYLGMQKYSDCSATMGLSVWIS
ncbi:MAG: hypothetical protein MUP40_06255, partial [Actinobacteria bacterium]|nr:hypothetical protein [Actinomycetota bacterium]